MFCYRFYSLSGMSTPLTNQNIFHKFASRIRYDSASRKEIEWSWIRSESKKILEEFFTELESEEEESGAIQKLKTAANTLSETGNEPQAYQNALKIIAEIIKVYYCKCYF